MDKIFAEDHKQIIENIRRCGFTPSDFEIKNEGLILSLVYPETPFSFTMERSPNDFHSYKFQYTRFTPTYKKTNNTHKEWISITDVNKYLTHFLTKELKPYLDQRDAPNPWDEFGRTFSESSSSYEETIDVPFSTEELKLIDTKLDNFQEIIAQLNLLDSTTKSIQSDIQILRTDARKDTKKRWIWKAVGLTFTIGNALHTNQEARTAIMYALKELVTVLTEVGKFLPPGGVL